MLKCSASQKRDSRYLLYCTWNPDSGRRSLALTIAHMWRQSTHNWGLEESSRTIPSMLRVVEWRTDVDISRTQRCLSDSESNSYLGRVL